MSMTQLAQKAEARWREVRRRLDELSQATDAASSLSPERAKAIMDERARLLARVPAHKPRATEMLEIATFTLADERYAVEARHVREVLRSGELTPVPGAPEFLAGLVNLRGEILAVVDLRRFLGIAEAELTDRCRIIVLGHQRAEFGMLADEVYEVTTVPIDDVFAPPGSVAGIGREPTQGREPLRSRVGRGVTKDALIILDGSELLAERRLFIDQSEAGTF